MSDKNLIPVSEMQGCNLAIDMDYVRYSAGYASEKRSIMVVNKKTGDEHFLKTRTEFYGRSKAKNGGWLKEYNAEKDTLLTADDFDIFDIQTPEPIQNTLHTAKKMTEGIISRFSAKKWTGYYGAGDSFRVERSTIIGYKMNRENSLKPIAIDDITEYLVKKFNITPCIGLEADDWTIIDGHKPNTVVVTHDKDALGCNVLVWNPQKPDQGVRDCRCFGEIWMDDKGNLRGYGRKFFYAQVSLGDSVDNYFVNSASDVKWGDVSSYNALKDCVNDSQCLAALVSIYKHVYPSPKTIIGWRGDRINIDWLYVMQENWTMAHMLRTPDEKEINVKAVLDKMKVKY